MSRGAGSKEKKKKKLQKLRQKRDLKVKECKAADDYITRNGFSPLALLEIPVSEVLNEVMNSISNTSLRNWTALVMFNWISLGMNWDFSDSLMARGSVSNVDIFKFWPKPKDETDSQTPQSASGRQISLLEQMLLHKDDSDSESSDFKRLLRSLVAEKKGYKAAVSSLACEISNNELAAIANLYRERASLLASYNNSTVLTQSLFEQTMASKLASGLYPFGNIDSLWETFFSAQQDILLVYDEPDLRHVFQLFAMMELDCTVDDPVFRIDPDMICRIYAFVWNYLPRTDSSSLEFPDLRDTIEYGMIPEMIAQSPLPSVQLYMLDHPHCCPAAFIEQPTVSLRDLSLMLYTDQKDLEDSLQGHVSQIMGPFTGNWKNINTALKNVAKLRQGPMDALAQCLALLFSTNADQWLIPLQDMRAKISKTVQGICNSVEREPQVGCNLYRKVKEQLISVFSTLSKHLECVNGSDAEFLYQVVCENLNPEDASLCYPWLDCRGRVDNLSFPLFESAENNVIEINPTDAVQQLAANNANSASVKAFIEWAQCIPNLLVDGALKPLEAYFAYLDASQNLLLRQQANLQRRIYDHGRQVFNMVQKPNLSDEILQRYCDCVVSGLQALTVVFCRLVMRRYMQTNGIEVSEIPENGLIKWDTLMVPSACNSPAVSASSGSTAASDVGDTEDGLLPQVSKGSSGVKAGEKANPLLTAEAQSTRQPTVGTTIASYSKLVSDSLCTDFSRLLENSDSDVGRVSEVLHKIYLDKPKVTYEDEVKSAKDPEWSLKLLKAQSMRMRQLEVENELLSNLNKGLQETNDQYRMLSIKIQQYLSVNINLKK